MTQRSNRWSCGTLKDGFDRVMDDALAEEEQKLEKEIQDCFKLSSILAAFVCTGSSQQNTFKIHFSLGYTGYQV